MTVNDFYPLLVQPCYVHIIVIYAFIYIVITYSVCLSPLCLGLPDDYTHNISSSWLCNQVCGKGYAHNWRITQVSVCQSTWDLSR